MTLDAAYPIALLPVRLETKFLGPQLRIRMFPDDLWADTHETGLTAPERADGDAYVAAKAAGPDDERAAWAAMVARWTAPRAAYVVSAVLARSTETRQESWTRAAQALLPDRWIVRAYQGEHVFTATSAAVQRPLALTFSPASTPADRVTISDDLAIDAALQWTVDFAAATAAGMAVTIDLTAPDVPGAAAPDPAAGVDLIVAVGVSESQDPADAAAQLRALIDAQHHTRGVAFVQPGTPTNNTPAAAAPFPPADPGGAASFKIERGEPLVNATSPAGAHGMSLAHALGLPLAAVDHLDGATVDGDTPAAAMNDALWPATLGYFLEQMMTPEFDQSTIDRAHTFFTDRVRPGGPLPSLRVGEVPYGVLPAISVDRLAGDQRFTTLLRTLRDQYFVPATTSVARVTTDSPDPDGDLLKVLALDASTRALRMRVLLGVDFTTNAAGLLGAAAAAEQQLQQAARAAGAAATLGTVGLSGQTRIGALNSGTTYELIGGPLVTSAPLSEEHGLDGADGSGLNYITWLHDNATSNRAAVSGDELPGTARPLLYRLLRHALLVEMDRVSFYHLLSAGVVAAADRFEPELVQMSTAAAAPATTAYQRIDQAAVEPVFAAAIAPYLERLAALADLPTAELERRFGETLDACSHRLDAWITAAATERIYAMREAKPDGCHLGGFGFVEDVRPASASTAPAGGYVHAPSVAHAGAAAILRNGFLSRGGAGSAYDVDLSSARVRSALSLLDGTRAGEPLSALLGQRFERDLHDRKLDLLIAPLRALFPLVAGKTAAGDGPVELVAAGNVVDGLAMRQAWTAKAAPFAGPSALPTLSATRTAGLHAALDALNDAVDAVADVLTAESVFQAVRGNPVAAVAGLDAMASGTLPPSPEVTRTPLGGTSFVQRLAVTLSPGVPATGAWGARTPRAAAEPVLDGWAGTLLGTPISFGCSVSRPDGSTKAVRLDALGLRPLDLVALARTQPSGLGDHELDRRLLAAAGAPAGSRVLYDTTNLSWTVADALELARAIGALLAVARPLVPSDLTAPADASSTVSHDAAADAAARAQAAVDQVGAAATALDKAVAAVVAVAPTDPSAAQLAALHAALATAAGFGIPGAYPPTDADAGALLALARGVRKELAVRAAVAPPATGSDPALLLKSATKAAQAVFGDGFLLVAPIAAPDLADPLGGSRKLVGDPDAPRRALQQLARVRGNLGRWRSMWLYGQAFGAAAPALEVVQLPTADRWAGLPGAVVDSGTLSLIVHRPDNANPAGGWTGLIVDEWTETIPSPNQDTALSFRHESPVAEAPQAILLAVPPATATATATAWDHDTLLDTVRETLTLAKIRTVDSSLLDSLRPFLPAICLTGNTANETVSTSLLGSIVAEAVVKAT